MSDEPEKRAANKGEGKGQPRDRGEKEIEISKNDGCALSFYIRSGASLLHSSKIERKADREKVARKTRWGRGDTK